MEVAEQNLSQKMSHLFTSITTNEKESLIEVIKFEITEVPHYLTKRNTSFKQMLCTALSSITTREATAAAAKSNNNGNMDELRKIAILIYKIMIIQTYHLLWTIYLKSGVGQLIKRYQTKLSYSTTLPIWSKEIKVLVRSKNIDNTNENERCLKFVRDHLHELDHQLEQYQTELNIKANNFQGYTFTVQKLIETYIEHNLYSRRMEIEHKVELVHYDYHIQAIKLKYQELKPNTFQEQLMKDLCQSIYEKETTEQEVYFLQQQITYSYHSPSQSFECSSIAHDPLINSIQNPDMRQELLQQYKEIATQSRANIFTLYMNTAEEERAEYKKKHETNLKKMWDAYHSSSDNEKISPKMLDLIHQRCMKISERIKCIYKFKTESIIPSSKIYQFR